MNQEKMIDEFMLHMIRMAQVPRRSILDFQTRGESALLIYLYFLTKKITPGELSDLFGVSTARMSVALRQMEGKGLVRKEVDRNDRRRIWVTLTSHGECQAEEKTEKLRGKWDKIIHTLGKEDSEAFLRILGTLEQLMLEEKELRRVRGDLDSIRN